MLNCGKKAMWRKADTCIRSLSEKMIPEKSCERKQVCSDIESRKGVGDFVCGCVSAEVERNKGKLCSGL